MLVAHTQFIANAAATYFPLCIAFDGNQQQLRQFDDKISTLTDYAPVNLGDSDDDDDEEEDFDIEIEKQRRRANAAILALETAAKEADEDAQADVREDSDCKRPCEKIRKKPANAHRERCVPSPTGPPPAGAPRNGRRGQGVPRPRWVRKVKSLLVLCS